MICPYSHLQYLYKLWVVSKVGQTNLFLIAFSILFKISP